MATTANDEPSIDPYTTLPQETTDYIQLRFQLRNFKVHRIVQLPITFTFANLHMLIQYMFGWSGSHLHQAEVVSNIVLDQDQDHPGTIKSCGRKRPLEDWEQQDELALRDWHRFEPENQPIYRVVQRVGMNNFDTVMEMEERALTLESIWTHKNKNNVSDGECSNAAIGIVYEYDLGGILSHRCSCIKKFTLVLWQSRGLCTSLTSKEICSSKRTLPAIFLFSEMPRERLPLRMPLRTPWMESQGKRMPMKRRSLPVSLTNHTSKLTVKGKSPPVPAKQSWKFLRLPKWMNIAVNGNKCAKRRRNDDRGRRAEEVRNGSEEDAIMDEDSGEDSDEEYY